MVRWPSEAVDHQPVSTASGFNQSLAVFGGNGVGYHTPTRSASEEGSCTHTALACASG